MQDATQRELKQAAKLLYSAAGIQHLSLVRPTAAPAKAGGPSASSSSGSSSSAGSGGAALEGGFLTAANVNLVLRNDTPPHLGAIKELVYVYREGGWVGGVGGRVDGCTQWTEASGCLVPMTHGF
jgi:hypothetical protein